MFLKRSVHWPLLLMKNRYIFQKIIIVEVEKNKIFGTRLALNKNNFEKRKRLAIGGSSDGGVSDSVNGSSSAIFSGAKRQHLVKL